jgi:hypothetical protein
VDNEWSYISGYGLIKGKPELRDKLNEMTTDEMIIVLLCEPMLWEQIRRVERGVFPKYGVDRSHTEIRIRLTFLASLWHTYVTNNDANEICAIIKNLLGSPPISYTVFDKWWTIKPFEQHLKSSEYEEQLSAFELEIFDKTGNSVADKWLETLIEQKKSTP